MMARVEFDLLVERQDRCGLTLEHLHEVPAAVEQDARQAMCLVMRSRLLQQLAQHRPFTRHHCGADVAKLREHLAQP
jgi:hypothetical protein